MEAKEFNHKKINMKLQKKLFFKMNGKRKKSKLSKAKEKLKMNSLLEQPRKIRKALIINTRKRKSIMFNPLTMLLIL